MNTKLEQRQKIRYRIRKKVAGTATKPRLSVFRSNMEIYAQLIDDDNSVTLASSSSKEKEIAAQKVNKVGKAKLVGESIARKAVALGLEALTAFGLFFSPSIEISDYCDVSFPLQQLPPIPSLNLNI